MTDYEFSKKPRRMTTPPANQSEWLVGYEGVEVVLETDPARISYFAREATWGDIMREPTLDDLSDTLEEVAAGKVLGAAKEVPALGFRIKASRSTMDQMLRLRESAAGAQTTRDNDFRAFNIIVPNTIDRLLGREHNYGLAKKAEHLVEMMRELYGEFVDAGIPPQDARYLCLPLGFQTHWIQIMNLRALEKMCEQRLCNGLTQHETNYVVRRMRDEAVKVLPWAAAMLRSGCEKRGQCSKNTMLFPGCGAFDMNLSADDSQFVLKVHEYDPEKHLYEAGYNDAMQFARWDVTRRNQQLENPSAIYSMAGPPEEIA